LPAAKPHGFELVIKCDIMKRSLLCWLAPLLIVGSCMVPAPAQGPGPLTPNSAVSPGDNSEAPPRTAVPQFAIAFLCTIAVMLVVCMPSRKS
jgi:hypothetical protein